MNPWRGHSRWHCRSWIGIGLLARLGCLWFDSAFYEPVRHLVKVVEVVPVYLMEDLVLTGSLCPRGLVRAVRLGSKEWRRQCTSNDCAYQSLTFWIDGISLSLSGRSFNSCTRWASRMGNSSERNWEARKRVPGDTRSVVGSASSAESTPTGRWPLAKLHHLPQAHAGGGEGGVMLDGVHQHVRLLPRHGAAGGPCGLGRD